MLRSVMEYSAFIFNIISNAAKNKIEAIQNNALRRIYKKDRRFGNINLLKLATEAPITERMQSLHEKYMHNAIDTDNPIIQKLIVEYKNYKGGREISVVTPLCSVTNIIDEHA